MTRTRRVSTRNIKSVSAQKLFGCIGNEVKQLVQVLSEVKVAVKQGKRSKPKKNSGLDHAMQAFAAKLCNCNSLYKMRQVKTPKVLKKMGIRFLEKSTHYDNIENIDVESIWEVNAKIQQQNLVFEEQPLVMLDLTPDPLKSRKYEASRDGYIGRKKDQPLTGNCHQIASASFAGQKQAAYVLRIPGNYNAFSNPTEHKDTKLSGLNFNETVAKQVVLKTRQTQPGKAFLWLFDRGFNCHDFWAWLKKTGDDFITAADSNIECLKQSKRLIDSEAVVLKEAKGFSYWQTLAKIKDLTLKAFYIKPHGDTKPYWLLTTKLELSGEEAKKTYNKRSGDEPLYDWLKNDYNVKKPCKKNFQGAQAYTALLCLVHNIISLLSQKIFNAYHRLTTLTSYLLELVVLESLFNSTPQPKTKDDAPPPANTQPSAGKNKME